MVVAGPLRGSFECSIYLIMLLPRSASNFVLRSRLKMTVCGFSIRGRRRCAYDRMESTTHVFTMNVPEVNVCQEENPKVRASGYNAPAYSRS